MRIKKKFQGTIPENKIMDAYSTNKTDTYSCNYVNNIRQIIYLGMEEQSVGTAYVDVAFSKVKEQVGNALTLEGNCVKVGKNVNKVMIHFGLHIFGRASGQTPVVRVYVNDTEIYMTGISCTNAWANDAIIISGLVASVKENDLIKIRISGNTDNVGLRNRSTMTVEKVA